MDLREAAAASASALLAHVTLVSWSLMEQPTQISPQGPALSASLVLTSSARLSQ